MMGGPTIGLRLDLRTLPCPRERGSVAVATEPSRQELQRPGEIISAGRIGEVGR